MSRSVSHWLGRLRPSTAKISEGIFRRWLKWLESEGEMLSGLGPDELVAFQLAHRDYQILDKVQEFVKGIDGRASYKKRLYSTLLSFFMHNRMSLPSDPGFKIRGDRPPVNGLLKVEEIRMILGAVNPMYRALFLCMFQGGMGMSEFQHWNRTGLQSLREQLSRGRYPVRIDLPGRKMNYNVKPFYTFIGGDAIKAVKNWLEIRPDTDLEVIFLSRDGTAPTERTIRDYWLRYLKRLGLITPKKDASLKTRYGKNLHEIRDTFRTRWRPSGSDVEVAEFLMGHDLDRLGYDKSPWEYPGWFEEQYLAAEPWLNVLSEDPERIPVRDHRKRLREYEDRNRRLRETLQVFEDRLKRLEVELQR